MNANPPESSESRTGSVARTLPELKPNEVLSAVRETATSRDTKPLSPNELDRRATYRRAVEAAIWGMPMVSVDAMREAIFRDAGAQYNDIIYFSKPADWKFQFTTPNASTHYVYFNFNLKDGAAVLDVPPAVGAGLFGSLVDAWEVPVSDVGPAGDDQGKGGKYLLVPPNFNQALPAGYFPVHFQTVNGYALLRAIPASSSEEDQVKAIELVKKLRLYPLALTANPPKQNYIDMSGKLLDGVVAFDETFYARLAKMVNEEPVLTRDLVALGQLRSLGIEKGKEFKPDEGTKAILRQAAQEAHEDFMVAVRGGEPWWPGTQWKLPEGVGPKTGFTFQTDDSLYIDNRGMIFFLAFAAPKKLGAATFYLVGSNDPNGQILEGQNTYRLHVPANVPAKQYWAVTAYALDTACLIRNMPSPGLDSYNQKMRRNPDGSVDIYFGPKAPAGQENNWVPTAAGEPWFTMFRFYGPDKALFDKTWTMANIEPVTSVATSVAPVPTRSINTRIGTIELQADYPSEASVEKLYDELDFERAVQAYIWATPLVSLEALRIANEKQWDVGFNTVGLVDGYTTPVVKALTGNNTTIYAVVFVDLERDGPVVIDSPEGAYGVIDDAWQRPIVEVGPFGPDKGKGGKFLLVPTGYQGTPPPGYLAATALTNRAMYLGRAFVKDGDTGSAANTLALIKVYPLSKAENPPVTKVVRAGTKPLDSIAPSGFGYWEVLANAIEHETVEPRDRFFYAMLRPLGIEKGKPFKPDARQREILTDAAQVGFLMGQTLSAAPRLANASSYPGTHWEWVLTLNPDQEGDNYSQLDERTDYTFEAITVAAGMVKPIVGAGSQYMSTAKDNDGAWLNGGTTYRLHVPPNVPVKEFWSVTVYDNLTRSMIQTDTNHAGLDSHKKLHTNPDGSVDLFFGPIAPTGHENNWIKTLPGKGWFVYFRWYGPTQEFFDKAWTLSDIEKAM